MAIRVLPHECGWLWSGCHGTCQSSGISRTQSTNGLAERYVAVVEEILRTCVNYKQTDWEEMTPTVANFSREVPFGTTTRIRKALDSGLFGSIGH
jgi:hypothetical protein